MRFMKKILIYCFTIFTLFVGAPGCSDWLNVRPTDGVIVDEYWKTKEDVSSFMTGVYSSLLNNELVSRMFLWGEWRADMITSSPSRINVNIYLVMQGEISSSNFYCSWAPFYKTINQCNTLLHFTPKVLANDASFTPKSKKEVEAQAIVVRSLMYFYLVRTFGDVPFVREAYIDNSQEMIIPKTKQEDILPALIADLNSVIDDLPVSYSASDAAQNKGKVTKNMARTLLADIYLWNNQYTECSQMCDQVIASGTNAIYPVARTEQINEGLTPAENDTFYVANESDANAMFSSVYANGNSVESIFELQFNSQQLNPLYGLLNGTSGTLIANTENLFGEIFSSSRKSREFSDIRAAMAQNQSYVWKYIGLSRVSPIQRIQTDMVNHFILYRLTDVYLMKAEALNQLGIQNESQDLLQQSYAMLKVVRDRANATDGTDLLEGNTTQINGKTLERFILQERAREFSFEGKRWFDVLRNAKRNYPNNIDYLLNLAQYSTTVDKVLILQNKYKNNPLCYYLPIYDSELKANPSLVQNAFYGESTTTK